MTSLRDRSYLEWQTAPVDPRSAMTLVAETMRERRARQRREWEAACAAHAARLNDKWGLS
jgi:hypothetical protein